jgi:hypothetical protein
MIRIRHWAAAALAAAIGLSGVPALAAPHAPFEATLPAGPKPWTHQRFDDAPSTFSFAVVSDLESGYRPGVFDVAAAELALLHPAFIMTVGDMIEGGTEDEALLNREWDAFDALAAKAPAPFFHVAGNHDMTNLTQRKVWEARYGARYYGFVYRDVLFMVLDTEDYSPERMQEIYRARADFLSLRKTDPAAAAKLPYTSMQESKTGEISPAQSAYFEKLIAAHPKVRWTIALMHKPVYARPGDKGLARIEAALKGRPYTILNGHLHRYSYAQRNGADYIMLGTTGGERAFDGSAGAMDHVMWITMTDHGPDIANLKLDGVLDKTGHVPAGGEALCLDHGGPHCPAP